MLRAQATLKPRAGSRIVALPACRVAGPQRRVAARRQPCRGRVSCSSCRVVAWLAVSRDTPQLARLPMSQYNPCIAIHFQPPALQPQSQYTLVYCNTIAQPTSPSHVTIQGCIVILTQPFKPTMSQYNDCIVTHSPATQATSYYNTISTHKAVTIQILLGSSPISPCTIFFFSFFFSLFFHFFYWKIPYIYIYIYIFIFQNTK